MYEQANRSEKVCLPPLSLGKYGPPLTFYVIRGISAAHRIHIDACLQNISLDIVSRESVLCHQSIQVAQPVVEVSPNQTLLTEFNMPRFTQAQVEDDESNLFAYREEHFKMAARVDISRLVFDKTFKRQMSNRLNINRLERILSTQGCHRLMEECHVPVLVSERDWGSRVRPRTVDGQFQQLDVDIDYELRGLDHESLIIAARNKLRPSSQWWIVDVYVTEPIGSSLSLSIPRLYYV